MENDEISKYQCHLNFECYYDFFEFLSPFSPWPTPEKDGRKTRYLVLLDLHKTIEKIKQALFKIYLRC